MIVSVGLPTCMEGMMYPVPFATPQQIVEIAKHAEALGYHSVWGNDHMTTQRYVREEFDTPPNFWEPLVTYSYLAAQTTRLRFGTGMLVTPMRRDLVVVAKQVATLDHFSGGRFILGFGVGAYREEFEALHPDWKAHRGELVEEGIQAMKVLFEQRSATWRGKYYHFEDVEMYPKPLQMHLPFYVGGNDPNASRRAATYADGWLPAGMPAEQMQVRIAQFKEQVQSLGRDFNKMDVAPQLIAYVGKTHEQAFDRFAHSQMFNHLKSLAKSTLKGQSGLNYAEINLVGAPDEVIEKAQRFAEAGVKHFCGTYFCADSVSELMDQMQVFSEEIMPHLSMDPV